MPARLFAATAVLGLLCAPACGSDSTALVVVVDVSRFSVPEQIDRVYLEVQENAEPRIGKTFVLPVGATKPAIEILPGERLAATGLELVVHGLLGDALIATTRAGPVEFAQGKRRTIETSL